MKSIYMINKIEHSEFIFNSTVKPADNHIIPCNYTGIGCFLYICNCLCS